MPALPVLTLNSLPNIWKEKEASSRNQELAPQFTATDARNARVPETSVQLGLQLATRAPYLCMGDGLIRAIGTGELVHLALSVFFGDAVALRNSADEVITFSTDALEIVVCQLAPFFFPFSRGLFPFSFNLIPVHETSY